MYFHNYPFVWNMAWTRLTNMLPSDNQVLASIHQTVIPHLSNPTMLWWVYLPKLLSFCICHCPSISAYICFTIHCSDFLTKSYDIGGVVSVMALSSLFILMTQHGLEYPNFYEKLYALLVPSVFVAKHRAKFLQVLPYLSNR